MNLSLEGEQFVKAREALRLEAYKDVRGVWTIGWGHTVGVKEGDVCTIEQAEAWFRQDMAPCEACVTGMVTVPLTQGQFDALCSFTYNLGCAALRNSHRLLPLLNAGDYAGAAAEFMRWDHAGGIENEGLKKRRALEVAMFNDEEGTDGRA